MLVLPAVDIKDGACVRLRQGKAEETTVFAADPVAAARAWEAQGAQYLHVIDLDGAFLCQHKSSKTSPPVHSSPFAMVKYFSWPSSWK